MATPDAHTPPADGHVRLVFVYNVDGTPLALLKDAYVGLTTGSTDCHLCDLTFGRIFKDRGWTAFVEGLPYEVDFQLRSTFTRRHPEVDVRFPAAFVEEGDDVTLALTASQIEAAADLDALRSLVGDLVAGLRAER